MRESDHGLVALLLFVVEVTLKLDIDIVPAINGNQGSDNCPALVQAISERTFLSPREADETRCEFLQIVSRRTCF